ncbi:MULTISPECIES: HEAT repeat domain-containing protein [Legionella]|uniref:HEAT repeat domain-containing protein n=1 Tax=Legionella septentrionalis TaxID=2498109 RepID=A0A433JM87_9GAMM|nr:MULTISPECIES: HEAT repeat domain-containing protein [Legionella]MCP0914741.1 HEAT repeat domain-containing protein [Legionella sp. 27cVA30]RUQ91116.1 HEAT repeat domain-containing protein [Legionella septentrionalis]RUR02815.1 HEAT repeat domain-containing protein [Legionella septentrionalis]RUR11413.1 HEAT repeat domain-containing protein [Legionella septentrionalis]RUR15112.1 HEAT repeat domain-containing protein [Legionella septentrionalis]
MKYIVAFLTGFFLCTPVFAQSIVDVYGVDEKKSEKILKQHAAQIGQLEEALQKKIFSAQGKVDKSLEKLLLQKLQLTESIKKQGNFLFVEFQTVFYPTEPAGKQFYTTIEIIEKQQPERMRFVTPKPFFTGKRKAKNNLIDSMIEYTRLETQLIGNNEIDEKKMVCPFYHCAAGFAHPKLKPYLQIFKTHTPQEKPLIISTMNEDEDPERRAAAAFLIGQFNDPQEIITLLLPHVLDADDGVRNNVIRVIDMTMLRANINKINVEPFIALLDSPYVSDRNKSLFVLLQASKNGETQKILIEKAGNKLLALLKLKQLNNHEIAYAILKSLSGKNYGENDLVSWQKWLTQQNKPA